MAQGALGHSVAHRGYAQRALLRAAWLGNVDPPHGPGRIAAAKLLSQPPDVLFQSLREGFDRHAVHAGRSALGSHFRESRKQVVRLEDLVHQAVPFASFHSLFESCQHALGPGRRFGPRPAGADLLVLAARPGRGSIPLVNPLRGLWRVGVRRSGHCASTFLRPLAPRALPRFIATMGALTPARPALRRLAAHEHRLCRHAGLPDSRTRPS
jgi:hypothetical protein